MKEKIQQFMAGRYGADQLSRFLMGCGIATLLLYMLLGGTIWYYLTVLLLIWNYFRAMSRNYNKRYQENLKFLQIKNQLFGRFRKGYQRDKTHKIYSCPSCKQKVRVPKGKGKISITCPKCHAEFIKST